MPARQPNRARVENLSPRTPARLYDSPAVPKNDRERSATYHQFANAGHPHAVKRSRQTMSIGFSKRDRRPGLYCIELRTADWERSVQWYREALGLRVLMRVVDDGYALLEAGETRLAILARNSPGDASPRWSLGFEVDDVDIMAARLTEAGSEVSRPRSNPEGLQEILTTDPDGNSIRLFAWPEG